MAADFLRHFTYVSRDPVVGNFVFEGVEPEVGDAVENLAFVRNSVGENNVEGGNTIGCDDEKLVAEVIHFPDFSA